MTDPAGSQLTPPADHQAFERWMRRLFAKLLGNPLVQLNGKNGDPQHGVDIFARLNDGSYLVIQCKLKDMLAADPDLRRKQFRDEAVAARARFKPSVGQFILATTAANDSELQEYARILSEEFAPDGIEVQYYGWHQLRTLIGEDPELREAYLGIEGVSALRDAIEIHHGDVSGKLDQMTAVIESLHVGLIRSQMPAVDPSSPHLKRALDRIRARIERGDVRSALDDLLALREDEWADASAENRFAMLTQIGSAHWRIQDFPAASQAFEEAQNVLPDQEKGLANLATALAATGEVKRAHQIGLRLRALWPETEMGLVALIQSRDAVDPLADPLDAVPRELREHEEALLGAIQVLLNRGDTRWMDLTRHAAQRYPGSDLVQRMSADAILFRLARTQGAHAGKRDPLAPTESEIEAAIATLQRLWTQHLATKPVEVDTALARNLAQLLRARSRASEAILVLEQAGPDTSDDGSATHILAGLLVQADRMDEARARLADRLDVLENRLLACHLAGDPAKVLALLADGTWSEATGDQLLWRGLLELEARAVQEPGAVDAADFEALAAEYPDRLMPLIALGRGETEPDAIREIASRLHAAVGPATPFSDILQAADWMRCNDLPKEVVSLLRNRISYATDSLGLHWLIQALFDRDDREALDEILAALPVSLAQTMPFLEYRAVAYFNRGEIMRAREAVEELLRLSPGSLKARNLWVQILLRQNERATIGHWLESAVEDLDGSVAHRADLGHLLADFGHHARAQAYSYRLARTYPQERIAQEKFVAVCLIHPVSAATPVIAADTVFTLSDARGEERTWRIEGDPTLPRDAIDLAPASEIAKRAMGLREGASFSVPASIAGAPDAHFTVGSILHKHVHYFRFLADTLESRFGGMPMLHKVTIDPDTGAGLEVIHANLRLESERIATLVADYRKTAFSIRMLALGIGRDVIDCYDGLREVADGRFLAETSARLGAEMQQIALNRRRGCVIDALTVEIVRRLDLLDVVKAVMGPLLVSQATPDLYAQRQQAGNISPALRAEGTSPRQGLPENLVRRQGPEWPRSERADRWMLSGTGSRASSEQRIRATATQRRKDEQRATQRPLLSFARGGRDNAAPGAV